MSDEMRDAGPWWVEEQTQRMKERRIYLAEREALAKAEEWYEHWELDTGQEAAVAQAVINLKSARLS